MEILLSDSAKAKKQKPRMESVLKLVMMRNVEIPKRHMHRMSKLSTHPPVLVHCVHIRLYSCSVYTPTCTHAVCTHPPVLVQCVHTHLYSCSVYTPTCTRTVCTHLAVLECTHTVFTHNCNRTVCKHAFDMSGLKISYQHPQQNSHLKLLNSQNNNVLYN